MFFVFDLKTTKTGSVITRIYHAEVGYSQKLPNKTWFLRFKQTNANAIQNQRYGNCNIGLRFFMHARVKLHIDG